MIHFSNAIACDQGTDFHMDDGNAWADAVCVSAFDGLHPDEPANLTKFDIVDIGAKLHRDRRDRLKKLKDQEKKEKEALVREKDAAIKEAHEATSPDTAYQNLQDEDGEKVEKHGEALGRDKR